MKLRCLIALLAVVLPLSVAYGQTHRVHGTLPALHIDFANGEKRTAQVVGGVVSALTDREIVVRAGGAPEDSYVFRLTDKTMFCGDTGELPRTAFSVGDEVAVFATDAPLLDGSADMHWQRGKVPVEFRADEVWLKAEQRAAGSPYAAKDVRKGLPEWQGLFGGTSTIRKFACGDMALPFP